MSLIHKYKLACGVALCIAAALCASCASDSDPVMSGTDEMVFRIDNVSRSHVTDQSNITQSPFAVYGDMILKENTTTHPVTVILNGTTVTYTDGSWTYPSTQYWMPKHEHSFVAIHPAGATNLSVPRYQNNQLTFTYKQPANYNEACDLLSATHRRYYDGGSTSDVRFSFSHILSRFGVNVTYNDPVLDQDAQLIVTGITFKNIPVEADYSIVPAALLSSNAPTSDYADGWTIARMGELEISFDDAEAASIPNDNKEHALFSDADALILMPNPAPETKTRMIVSFKLGDDGSLQQTTFDLPAWVQGRSYTLSLKMISGGILYNITVADWLPGDDNETQVPRK